MPCLQRAVHEACEASCTADLVTRFRIVQSTCVNCWPIVPHRPAARGAPCLQSLLQFCSIRTSRLQRPAQAERSKSQSHAAKALRSHSQPKFSQMELPDSLLYRCCDAAEVTGLCCKLDTEAFTLNCAASEALSGLRSCMLRQISCSDPPAPRN